MKIQILDRAKKKKFLGELAEFGVGKVSEMLVRTGKERVRAFSGSLDREAIMSFWRLMPVEGIGLYVGKEFVNRSGVREVRLSVDGMHAWKAQLKDRIFVLSEEQEVDWFLGKDVEIDEGQTEYDGFVLVKAGEDFVGMGKVGNDGKTLFGCLPKERRRRSSNV